MKVTELKQLYKEVEKYKKQEIILQGWIRNHRKQKEFGFIDFYDGTCFKSVQLVYDQQIENFETIQKIHIGSAITVIGTLEDSPKEGQDFEIIVKDIQLEGDCPEEYPIVVNS